MHARRVPRAEHAARLRAHVGLALDAAPAQGGGTTCDALAAGVPVLTITAEGAAAAARDEEENGASDAADADDDDGGGGGIIAGLGASLVGAAFGAGSGMVARGWRAYEDAAVALARDPGRLAALRRRLLDGGAAVATTAANDDDAEEASLLPVFDAARWARHFGAGLRAAWRRRVEALAPGTIDVAES